MGWPEIECGSEQGIGGFEPLAAPISAVLDSLEIALTIGSLCESPIEVDLGVQLTKAIKMIPGGGFSLEHQYCLGPYRYDLALIREGLPAPIALIECDGKEFHQSEQQVANDLAKDRLAQNEKIPLLRFSGSEIYRDVKACVFKIIRTLRVNGYLTQLQWHVLEAALPRCRPFVGIA